MSHQMKRMARSPRPNDRMELCLLDQIALFGTSDTITLRDTFAIVYQGGEPITMSINGRRHRFEGGVCTLRASDLLGGATLIEVPTKTATIPCEGLIYQGGFIATAGIQAKAYVLDLYARAKQMEALNAELQARVDELERQEDTDDLFDI